MSTITAIVSDTHIGSWTALSLHEWRCDTGEINNKGEPVYKSVMATEAQDWIMNCWLDFWAYVRKLAGKKHRIVVLHLGDVIDNIHHHTIQTLQNPIDQEDMAIEILKPVANFAEVFYIFRGTDAHAGGMGGHEQRIAQEIGAKCTWEGLIEIDGVLMDVAHHGRVGHRYWTSAASSMASQALMDAAMDNPPRPAPRYVFRGHNHIIDDSGEKLATTRAIAMPSFQLRPEYGYRAAPGALSDIGGLIVLPDGSLDTSKMRYFHAPGQRKIIKI